MNLTQVEQHRKHPVSSDVQLSCKYREACALDCSPNHGYISNRVLEYHMFAFLGDPESVNQCGFQNSRSMPRDLGPPPHYPMAYLFGGPHCQYKIGH